MYFYHFKIKKIKQNQVRFHCFNSSSSGFRILKIEKKKTSNHHLLHLIVFNLKNPLITRESTGGAPRLIVDENTVWAMDAQRKSMPRVKLGSQGLEVSKLGYGCMGLTGQYNAPVSQEDGIAMLKEAFSKGITFFDTADVYGSDFANEYLLGNALKQLPREEIQIATKFGFYAIKRPNVIIKGTAEYARACCEASLKRLQVDYIDLYYIHRIDTTVPIEETMRELKRLVEEGKIKYVGLSEASVDTIRRAHAVHPITALQIEYSLWTRDIEEQIIPLCRELGIGIVAYSPVGRGFFGGKKIVESLAQESYLKSHPRFTGENWEINKAIYFRLEELARKHNCTPAQLALSWVGHQGADVVPIPGTTKIKNLHDNLASVSVKLTSNELEEICKAVPIQEVAGANHEEMFDKLSWRFANTPLPKKA